MIYKDIEFVCSGNNGRSPVAEAAAGELLGKIGIKHISTSSSGTLVNLSGIDLGKFMIPHTISAIERGVIPADRMQVLDRNPKAVLDELVSIEERWRNRYITFNFGMDYSDHERTQTIARPEAELVLAVDQANLDRVREIYGSATSPRIELLPNFAGLNVELSEKSLSNYEEYYGLAHKVSAAARFAILNALGI